MSAAEETRLQIARCAALHKRFGEQRRALRRECALQRVVMRRAASHLEAAGHTRA